MESNYHIGNNFIDDRISKNFLSMTALQIGHFGLGKIQVPEFGHPFHFIDSKII